MYPASIQLSTDPFHQKHIGKNTPLKISNANTIAVAGSRRVCGEPVMTRSTKLLWTWVWNDLLPSGSTCKQRHKFYFKKSI